MNNTLETTQFVIRGDITSKQLQLIANAYADLDLEPIALGFKDNNLNETELKLYATKIMEYKHKHSELIINYEGGLDNIVRREKFFNFYNKYKQFVVTKGRTNAELQSTVEALKVANARLEKATTCYRELRDFALMVTETYISHAPKTFKIADTTTFNNKEYKPGKLVNITKIPMTILAAYVDTLADYSASVK